MTLDDIYTPPEQAKEELMRRWEDKELRKKAEEFIGHRECLPDYFFEKPHAITSEHIASPNLCSISFLETAKKIALEPMYFEYLEDIFVTRNMDKAYLAKMVFYHAPDDESNMITTHKKIIDLSGPEEKKKFTEIKTLWGEGFVDFHHRIFSAHFPDVKTFDGSKWYQKNGGKAKEYYEKFFAMGICHGLLFETFFDNAYEEEFTREVVLPSLKSVYNYFNLKPMISKIVPLDHIPKDTMEKHWWYYPEYIKTKI